MRGEKSFPSLRRFSHGHTAERQIPPGARTDQHEAGRAEEPWGTADCPQASPSPLTRRLQAENRFPSVCPDIPSAPRLFPGEQCRAFTLEPEARRRTRDAASEGPLHGHCWRPAARYRSYSPACSLLKPSSLWKPWLPLFDYKEAQVKRSLAGQFATLPSLALHIKYDSHRQNFMKKHSLLHL